MKGFPGHRWRSERDVDAGRAPADQLLLQGHAGLTAPSPTDAADLPAGRSLDDVSVVFGQAVDGAPSRWAVLCADDADRATLTSAINRACTEKLD